VLLAYEGSEASGRAIRNYLSTGLGEEAEHRLLAIGTDANSARTALRDMADYCGARCRSLETGCATGRPRRVIVPYAAKWQADLLVLGLGSRAPVVRRLLGNSAASAWSKLRCALFAAA
jgi:nucleotide-binding universal stress UspA family protein